MSDVLDKIFTELDVMAESAAKLRARADAAGRQTDLEVSILAQQLADLRLKNARSAEFIEKSLGILNKLKNPDNK